MIGRIVHISFNINDILLKFIFDVNLYNYITKSRYGRLIGHCK